MVQYHLGKIYGCYLFVYLFRVYQVCPEGIQPRKMKKRHVLKKRQEARYIECSGLGPHAGLPSPAAAGASGQATKEAPGAHPELRKHTSAQRFAHPCSELCL